MNKSRSPRTPLCCLGAGLLLAALGAVSLCVGSYPLSLGQIGALLTGGLGDTIQARVFFTLRLPRTLMAAVTGLALGLAGGVYQTVFRNPLASPDLTGVAGGASLGAAAVIVWGAGGAVEIMAGAFGAGLLSLALVLGLVRACRTDRTATYVLAGILVSALAEAGLMLLKTLADPERELAAIEYWTMGSLSAMTGGKLAAVLPVAVGAAGILLFRRQAALLTLGDESARATGLEPGRWRALLLGLATLMVAAVVSVTGVVAFVGLIAPHIAFGLLRRRGGAFLPLCGLVGADLLLAADLLARTPGSGAELPLSIFTVLFAAPVLCLLMLRRRGDGDAA